MIFVSVEYIETDETDDILIKQGWRGNVSVIYIYIYMFVCLPELE